MENIIRLENSRAVCQFEALLYRGIWVVERNPTRAAQKVATIQKKPNTSTSMQTAKSAKTNIAEFP